MCTLTIIPCGSIRVVCNRDESRVRPAALPPRVRTLGGRQAVMPIDPVSDGTWIGANDAGLVAVLMNVYGPQGIDYVQAIRAKARARVSRGMIVPEVLRAAHLRDAVTTVRELPHSQFEPFCVVAMDRTNIVHCVWSDGQLHVGQLEPIDRPRFFTSSGLADELVASPRRRLFEEYFAPGADWVTNQDAFHRHFWPENRQASVWMTRDNAMTVSRSEVVLETYRVTMYYHARVGDTAALVSSAGQSLGITEHANRTGTPP